MSASELAGVIRYGLKRREGPTRFFENGRIEIDKNIVEGGMRGIALKPISALFAGSEEGGAAWGVIASLIETCKLNGIERNAYLTKTLNRIGHGWPANRLDELLPWAYVA